MNPLFFLIYAGAVLLGAVYGSRVQLAKTFHMGTVIAVFAAGVLLAWMLGPYPFYTHYHGLDVFSFASVYVAALIGALIGSGMQMGGGR